MDGAKSWDWLRYLTNSSNTFVTLRCALCERSLFSRNTSETWPADATWLASEHLASPQHLQNWELKRLE